MLTTEQRVPALERRSLPHGRGSEIRYPIEVRPSSYFADTTLDKKFGYTWLQPLSAIPLPTRLKPRVPFPIRNVSSYSLDTTLVPILVRTASPCLSASSRAVRGPLGRGKFQLETAFGDFQPCSVARAGIRPY
jgi:hypothetical protein